MLELKNRIVDDYGNVVFAVKDLYPLIMKGFEVQEFLVTPSPEVQQFVETCRMLSNEDLHLRQYVVPDEPLDACMSVYRDKWLIPQTFLDLNVQEYLYSRCTNDEQLLRVHSELEVFERYELTNMLRSLIYLVDTFRKNEIVWGVGRGSSVASYVLFLIGIHRVDSIAYDLDFDEFLN